MNLFEKIKDEITVPQAAEFCGLRIGKGNMISCPFHQEKTPSMKLNDKYYYCFGCHAHGDAVSLAAQVLNLPQKDAAIRLADTFHIDTHDCSSLGRKTRGHVKPHRPDLKSLAEKLAVIQQTALIRKRQEWLDHAMQILGRYTQLINDWRIQFAPAMDDEEWHPLFVEACLQEAWIRHLQELLDDPVEREAFYDHYGEEISKIERRIDEYEMETADERRPA